MQRPVSGVGALTASYAQIDRAVGDRDAEGGADGSRHEPDFAAMRAYELRRDGQAESRAAGARRALKSLEHVGARLLGHARPGIGYLDYHYAAFTPSSKTNLVPCRIARTARLQSLHGITRNINENAKQLIVIGFQCESAFYRHNPSDRHTKTETKRLVHFLD